MSAGWYDRASEDSLSDFGIHELFNEAEGVIARQRGRSFSWPGWGVREKTRKTTTYEEYQLPDLVIYQINPIVADIQATRLHMCEFMAATESMLIKRLVDLRITSYIDRRVASRLQRIEALDSEMENSDEMSNDVMSDWPIHDGACPRCGCVGDCWQRAETHDMLTTEAATQTDEFARCGEEKHEYAECPARSNRCSHYSYRGHFAPPTLPPFIKAVSQHSHSIRPRCLNAVHRIRQNRALELGSAR